MAGHWQVPGEEIDVATWAEDEEHPHFPEGSRDKRLLRCGSPAPFPWLIAGHRYLFKKSRRTYPEQYWAEVVASRLSSLTGVPVPPAYAAWDSRTGECAALIEWFYDYPASPAQGLFSGGMFLKDMIENFDHVRGRQHNFTHISGLMGAFSRSHRAALSKDWLRSWAGILTFDALIGNTDRHQENWGLIWTREAGQPARLELTPAFDNGTSMGHELLPKHFRRYQEASELRRYIERGRHHLRWRIDDLRHCGHSELLLRILENSPESRPAMLSVLQFDPEALEGAILPLPALNLPAPLSPDRAGFMLTLVKARREYLLAALTLQIP